MKSLKGTKTEKNLWEAFAGECKARVKYGYFASKARKDGYEQIANVFDYTSNQEKEHAKIWFNYLNGIGTTEENLASAMGGEKEEYTDMYKRFAKVAKEEGFDEIAMKMEAVGNVEKEHYEHYEDNLKEVKDKTVFAKPKAVVWECMNCGFDFKGKEPPKVCPICGHPISFFKVGHN